MAGEPYVAGLLGLPGYGGDHPFQCVESIQPISPVADRCGTEKLETALKQLVDPVLTHAQMRAVPAERLMAVAERRATAEAIMERLAELRARCQRQTNSIVTPMGDEMFYRYQQYLIDEAATTVGALLKRSSSPSSRSASPAAPSSRESKN